MKPVPRRRSPSQFQRAADGSMTLIEHFRELRNRLFKAALGVLVGLIVGMIFAKQVQDFINSPYCDYMRELSGPQAGACQFNVTSPVDPFLIRLKVGLYVGLVLSAPIWLYQLWAFIAPGLHRNERRYTYAFTAIAVPLFAAGATMAFFVVTKSLHFFLGLTKEYRIAVDLGGYFSFVTNVMVLFGVAFEFPLIVLMLNFAGVLSARRMFGWWRPAVFLMFVFSAVVTPTPDPFGMTALALAMGLLYFGACAVAYVNDRRRAGRKSIYTGLSDDEISPLDDDLEAVEAGEPVDAVEPVPAPQPLERRYDDMT